MRAKWTINKFDHIKLVRLLKFMFLICCILTLRSGALLRMSTPQCARPATAYILCKKTTHDRRHHARHFDVKSAFSLDGDDFVQKGTMGLSFTYLFILTLSCLAFPGVFGADCAEKCMSHFSHQVDFERIIESELGGECLRVCLHVCLHFCLHVCLHLCLHFRAQVEKNRSAAEDTFFIFFLFCARVFALLFF